jgi:hypothetical protein
MIENLKWRKSSYSVANSACLEIAVIRAGSEPTADIEAVALRDSKDPSGDFLIYHTESWRWFIDDIRAGRLQRP